MDSSIPYRAPSDTALLEVAWEVCNQVGGIYQVLRSKASLMMDSWGDNYHVVGPYVPDKAAMDFEPATPPPLLAEVLDDLAREGIVAHYGRWLVARRPRVILLEFDIRQQRLDELKHELWRDFQIESPPKDALIDGAISFGWVASRLVSATWRRWCGVEGSGRLLAHFHEWQGAVAIPLLRRDGVPAATVFTTHATLIGRYIASSSDDLYSQLESIDASAQAEHFGIKTQHQIECVCARKAEVFTTVSPITGEECTHLLGRTPDVVTPNGINTDRYEVGHEFQTLHAQYQRAIRRFVMGHFFPSYSFDLDATLCFFTSGRFEPHNKGFDLCLAAMARLNEELKLSGLDRTVIFFIITSQPVQSLNPHALNARGILDELADVSSRIASGVAEHLFLEGARGRTPSLDDIADPYWTVRFRRTAYAFKSKDLPLQTTHVLAESDQDPIMRQLAELGLNNAEADRVKVVYHPQFINSVNPLWHIEYEQFVRGCHLGIFPSSYEPWGYTPLECVCMGVPAITSDLSGFGRYLADVHPDHDRHGITVLGRRDQDFRSSARELANRLLAFCRYSRRQRISLRNSVEAHSRSFDWRTLGVAYHQAHELALRRLAEL